MTYNVFSGTLNPTQSINRQCTLLLLLLLVVLLCGDDTLIRDFMLTAHDQGMADGDYVYISTDLLAVDNYERRWATGDRAGDLMARHAFEPLLQVPSSSRSSCYRYQSLQSSRYSSRSGECLFVCYINNVD